MSSLRKFFISTSKGLEPYLEKELAHILPSETRLEKAPGGFLIEGPVENGYKICLWSRFAHRVLLEIATFQASDEKQLYGGIRKIRWRDHFDLKDTFAIDFQMKDTWLRNSHFGALKTKDAIVDQFTSVLGDRPSVSVSDADIRFRVRLVGNDVTLFLDLSGESLYKRGYREEIGDAPLRETLAAAILESVGCEEIVSSGGAVLDPMCGSGTFVLEAALKHRKGAPQARRQKFGFSKWKQYEPAYFEKIREEAFKEERDPPAAIQFFGGDASLKQVRIAEFNAKRAGLEAWVSFKMKKMESWAKPKDTGLFVCNPPYGERLGVEEEWIPTYQLLGDTMKKGFVGWKGAIFTGSKMLSKEVGLRTERKEILWNGPIEGTLLVYDLYAGSKESPKILPVGGGETQ